MACSVKDGSIGSQLGLESVVAFIKLLSRLDQGVDAGAKDCNNQENGKYVDQALVMRHVQLLEKKSIPFEKLTLVDETMKYKRVTFAEFLGCFK